MITTPEPVLAFIRYEGAERIACAFNMSAAPAIFGDERLAGGELLTPSTGEASLDGAALHLGPHAARFLRLA